MDPEKIVPISTSSFYGKRYRTLGDALEDIRSSNKCVEADIVIIPPDADNQTDEEDFDDDVIEDEVRQFPEDIPGEIEVRYLDEDDNDSVSDEEMEIPLSVLRTNLMKDFAVLNRNEDSEPSRKKMRPIEPRLTQNIIDISLPSVRNNERRVTKLQSN